MKALLLRVAAVAMFILCSQAIFGLMHSDVTESSVGATNDLTFGSIITSVGAYGLVAFSLLFYIRDLPGMLLRSKLVLALPFFALASVAWSQDPALTMRRAFVLVAVSCIGACLGSVFSLEEMARLVTITSFAICVTTFTLGVVAPHIVHDASRTGVWKGIFAHKNSQGSYMALAFLTALHTRFERWQIVRYSTLLMSGLLLVLSQSSTSLVAAIIVVALLPLRYLVRVPGKQIFIALAIAAVLTLTAGFLVSQYYTEILAVLGKNATLSGRTELWGLIIDSILRRPLLGYGFNGFWLGLQGESLSIIAASGWLVPHAHNGLLDVLLAVGIIGTILFFLGFFRFTTLLIRYIRASGARFQDFWPVSFLVALIVINTTESILLSPNSIFWLLYVAIFANLVSHTAPSPRHSALAGSFKSAALSPAS